MMCCRSFGRTWPPRRTHDPWDGGRPTPTRPAGGYAQAGLVQRSGAWHGGRCTRWTRSGGRMRDHRPQTTYHRTTSQRGGGAADPDPVIGSPASRAPGSPGGSRTAGGWRDHRHRGARNPAAGPIAPVGPHQVRKTTARLAFAKDAAGIRAASSRTRAAGCDGCDAMRCNCRGTLGWDTTTLA